MKEGCKHAKSIKKADFRKPQKRPQNGEYFYMYSDIRLNRHLPNAAVFAQNCPIVQFLCNILIFKELQA